MNVKLIIRSKYSTFSKTYKMISDYILSNQEDVLNSTAIEIAKKCNASSASVIRFVQSIGFFGLDDFKIQLAKHSNGDGESHIDPIISKEDNAEILCDKLHRLIDTSNEDLFYQINKTLLKKSFLAMKNAENIYLLGIGASLLPAYDLFHKLHRAGFNSHFFLDTHMTVECFNYITKKDVVIAFSYSGITNEVVYPVEIALSKGANIIAVTRDKKSPLSKIANIILAIPENESLTRIGAITSKYSSMIISDILYLGLIQKDFELIEKELVKTSVLTRKLKLKDD